MATGYAELRGQLLSERDRLSKRIEQIEVVLGGIDLLGGGTANGNGKRPKATKKRRAKPRAVLPKARPRKAEVQANRQRTDRAVVDKAKAHYEKTGSIQAAARTW